MTAAEALTADPLPCGARLLVEDDTSASIEAEGLSVALYLDPVTGEWVAVRRRLVVSAVATGRTATEALAGLGSVAGGGR